MPAAIKWTAELESAVLADIESGSTLRTVAENLGISAALILKKVSASVSFREQYARAVELRTEGDFEGIADLMYEAPATGEHGVDSAWVNWRRLQIDTLKWALSKRAPKKYGDTAKLELSGADGGPLVVKHIASDGE